MTAILQADITTLAADHDVFGRAVEITGPITFRPRDPGLGTLLHLILEQQVSIDAARAMFARLVKTVGGQIAPETVLALDDDTMRRCGFTRQKAGYARGICQEMLAGDLDLIDLSTLDDAAAVHRLTALRGIGRWTATNYLLWALGRRDVFPFGDLALAIGWQDLTESAERPTYEELDEVARAWSPRRTAAALIIWHHYLAVRNRLS